MKKQKRKVNRRQDAAGPRIHPNQGLPFSPRSVRIWQLHEIFGIAGCTPISELNLPHVSRYWKEPASAERIGLLRVSSSAGAQLLNRPDNGRFAGVLVLYRSPEWGDIQWSVLHLDDLEVERALRAEVMIQ